MGSVARVGYILIDGLVYKASRDGEQSSVTRSHQAIEPSQLSGLRVQPPFLSSETQGFEQGEGLRTRDDIALGYYGGLGIEPHTEVPTQGHLRLKVGRQITQEALQASVVSWLGMFTFNNLLFVFPSAGLNCYTWDGTTLVVEGLGGVTANGSALRSVELDELYIGSSTVIVRHDGAAVVATISTAGVGTYRPLGTHLVTPGSTPPVSLLWFSGVASGNGRIYTYQSSGSTFTVRHELRGQLFTCGQAVGDTLYYWSYDAGNTRQPAAQLWSISMAGGSNPTPLVLVTDNYPTAVAEFRGDLYYGMAWGGSVRKLNGGALEEILHVGLTTPPGSIPSSDAIYAMAVYNDSLYVAGYDAAAASGQHTWLRRYDGQGWHPVSLGGNNLSTAIRSLGVFEQTLYLGDEEVSDARLYALDTSLRLTSARLDTADAVYGSTGVRKRFVSVSLQHSPLVAGQAVELRYVLDDGAEVSVGTNKDVGATVTTFPLPTTVRGTALRPRWYLTNVTGADLILSGDSVVALPAPPSREVWQADLQLAADAYDPSDTRTELDRYSALQTLQDTGAVFQVVHEYRDAAGLPLLAIRACFDPQVPLETRDVGGIGGGLMSAVAPVRLVQAAQPSNLVKNASFEQDGNAAVPTDWGTVIGSGTSANTDNGSAADGTYSLKAIFSGSASYGRSQSVSGLIPGRYYTISASIRRTTWATALANPQVDVNEAGVLTSGNSCGPGAGAATDAAFVRYSKTFLYPLTGSGTVLVRAFANGTPANGSTVLFDAIALNEGAPAMTPFSELGAGG